MASQVAVATSRAAFRQALAICANTGVVVMILDLDYTQHPQLEDVTGGHFFATRFFFVGATGSRLVSRWYNSIRKATRSASDAHDFLPPVGT